ncbi:MAG: hypothetical protein QOH36_1701 [Actinomycetota bacterium]|nr:hypothetical protein [Actinomycetota bacterium]MEA2971817.1 hypothetical protein [Actinomycetota bacterium]
MAQRASFGKLQRDRDKKAKAAAKREKRQERSAERADGTPDEVAIPMEGEVSAADLLVLVERLHKGFEDGTIDYEEFELQKSELFARLPID